MSTPEEDDAPVLSGSALAALHEFYAEKDVQQKRFEELQAAAENPNKPLSMEMFTEDWNASQFWYSDETASLLARELLGGVTNESAVAVVSAPSVFIQLKNLVMEGSYPSGLRLLLLEFDDRFGVLKEFIHYDFKSPLSLPADLRGQFDRIICDPPFLSEDCQTKAALTVRWLSKPASNNGALPNPKIIVCTGERMESLIHRVYPGTKTTTFEPQHTGSRLSNEFRCYANYEGKSWKWRQ